MARRSWKRNGVKGYAVGGMPEMDAYLQSLQGSAAQGVNASGMSRDQAKDRLMSSAQAMMLQSSTPGSAPDHQQTIDRMKADMGSYMGQLQGAQRPPGVNASGMSRDQAMQSLQQRASPQLGETINLADPNMRAQYGHLFGTGEMSQQGVNASGMSRDQAMPSLEQMQQMQQQAMQMRQQGMPQGQQGMDPRMMQQMQQQAMQMAMQRQQQMQQQGMRPNQLPSARTLQQMPTGQARQVLGQTLLGPQGFQQMQQQFMNQAGIRPSEMKYNMGGGPMAQQMGQRPQQQGMASNNAGGMMGQQPQQRSPFQQASGMGQQPQQRSPFQQGIGGMGAAASGARAAAFADGGSVDSRMAELDRYLSDPNLKMVRTKSGKFQFVPINQPAKRKAAAPKPAAKPMAKAAPKSRAAANAVPGASGKMKTGGGGMKGIQRPLSAFTGSKVKPVKPTGMKKSTPLPRDMTGVNQTPIRGRDIAGSMAKGAATGAMLGMGGMGMLGRAAGLGRSGKGVSKAVEMPKPMKAPAPAKASAPMTARAPSLPGVPKNFTMPETAVSLGSKTARVPKPKAKASEYASPRPKQGAAKRAAEALKKRNVTEEEAVDMMRGYRDGGVAKKGKPVPRGYHRMPDGRVMKNSAHKGKR